MHPEELVLHSISITLVVAAAVLALHLIRLTGTMKAWLFMALGLVLLAIQSFEQLLYHSGVIGESHDHLHLALVDAIPIASYALLLAGVIGSRAIFRERKLGLQLLQQQLDMLQRTRAQANPNDVATSPAALGNAPPSKAAGILPTMEYVKHEQRRISQSLQEWQATFDALTTPIFLYDKEYRILRANRAYLERAGLPLKDVVGRPYFGIFPQLDGPIIDPPHPSGQGMASSELSLPTGAAYISKSLPIYNEANEYRCSLHILEDITPTKQAEKSAKRIRLALKVVASCIREIPKTGSKTEMLTAICRAAVNSGFYRLAWIGRAQQDATQTLEILAIHGPAADIAQLPSATWSDHEASRSPASTAIITRKACVVQDLLHDPQFPGCHHYAAKHRLASAVALPLFRHDDIWGSLTLYSDEINAFSSEEIAVLEILSAGLSFAITMFRDTLEKTEKLEQRTQRLDALKADLERIIVVLETAIEARHVYGAAHQQLVGEIGMAIAQEMGLPEEKAYGVRLAGILHDFGEIKVPEEVIHKTGELTEAEREQIRQHPQTGYELLREIDLPWPLAQIVLQHHERLDGSGYPQGLSGDEILLEAKIVAVADTIEAMAYQRQNHPRLGLPAALEEVEKGKGTLFDPTVVDATLRLFREKGYQIA